jgi:hypothetical protein
VGIHDRHLCLRSRTHQVELCARDGQLGVGLQLLARRNLLEKLEGLRRVPARCTQSVRRHREKCSNATAEGRGRGSTCLPLLSFLKSRRARRSASVGEVTVRPMRDKMALRRCSTLSVAATHTSGAPRSARRESGGCCVVRRALGPHSRR